MNKAKVQNTSSKYKGVDKRYNKWRAQIRINNKLIHLGYFINFDDAVTKRKHAEQQYFGEFAPINLTINVNVNVSEI